ncbi:MAG: NmrA family NAD(P)-binding protein, partial [Stackebrandtia sp.]
SGSIGSHLVRLLTDAGTDVRTLVRDPAKGQALRASYALGDFDQPGTIAAALEGVDQFFLNGGSILPTRGEQPMVAQQRAAIDAAREAGVAHIVKISVWGVRDGGKLAEGAHAAIEAHLAASGIPATVLRPGGYMQNFITGSGTFFDTNGDILGLEATGPVNYIDCADIAACAAALLTGAAPAGGNHILTGPQALDHHQIAEKLSTVLEHPIGFRCLTPEALTQRVIALGVTTEFAADVVSLWSEMEYSATTDAVERLTGVAPRGFDDFVTANRDALAEALRPARN